MHSNILICDFRNVKKNLNMYTNKNEFHWTSILLIYIIIYGSLSRIITQLCLVWHDNHHNGLIQKKE